MRLLKSAVLGISLSVLAGMASASIDSPVAGKEYRVLPAPQIVESKGKVEVVEFFWYSCPHCNAFDPYLAGWVKAQGSNIVFKRVPVAFRPGDENQQKLYYALEAMGKNEQLHSKIFYAIHVDHQHLDTEAAIADFVASNGVNRDAFLNAFRSFPVSTKSQQATQMAHAYELDGVPLVAVNGHYETSPSIAGAELGDQPETTYFSSTLKVLDFLVAKAAKEKH